MSAISAALVHEGHTVREVAPLAVATAIGLAGGALLGGLAGDMLGRRIVILAAAFIVAASLIGSAFAPELNQLVLWRALTSFGVGIENVLAYGILIEFLPPAQRGRWLARFAIVATAASPLALLAGAHILPSFEGWRQLLLATAALSCATFALRWWLPESARWLAGRGRGAEADAIVRRFESAALADDRVPSTSAPEGRDAGAIAPLPARVLLTRLALASFLNIALVCATFGFVAWLPTFLAAEGRDLPLALMNSTLMMTGAPVGAFIGMILTDAFERKWSTAAAALAAAAFGTAYAFSPDGFLLPLGFSSMVAIYAFGAIGISAYMPELFPTPIRMRAIGAALTAGRVTAIVLPSIVTAIFTASGQAGVLSLMAAVLVVLALVLACFGVRTRGRPLDQI